LNFLLKIQIQMKQLINKKCINLLECPKTKDRLIINRKKNILYSPKFKNQYSIIRGIPVLIVASVKKAT